MTQVASGQIPFDKYAGMKMPFGSLSRSAGCMANNWREWDWLLQIVLGSHLDDVMILLMEVWMQRQLV